MRAIFVLMLITLPLLSKAQNEIASTTSPTPIYPEVRPVSTQFEQLYFKKFQYRYNGQVIKGKIEEESRFSALVTAPLLMRKKLILAASMHYVHESLEMEESQQISSEKSYLTSTEKLSSGSFSFSFSSVIKDSLFGRPVTLISNVYFDSHNMKQINRIRGVLIGTINLVKTEREKLSLGMAYAYNSTSSIPVTPIVRYWRKFNYSQWQLDAILPKSIYLRRPSKNLAWFGIGAEALNNSFYSNCNIELMPRKNLNSFTELRGALSYEYPLHKWVMIGAKMGVSRLLCMKVIDAKSAPTDYYIKGSGGFSPFLNINLSLTPSLNFSSIK